MGMIARLAIISCGIFLEIAFLIIGFLILIFFVFSPAIVIVSIIFFFSNQLISLKIISAISIVISFVLIIISAISFFTARKKDLTEMSLSELAQEKWFIRVWNRMGFFEPQPDFIYTFSDQKKLEDKLIECNLTLNDFGKIIEWEVKQEKNKKEGKKIWQREFLFSRQPIGKQWAYGYTVNLDKYSKDIQESFIAVEKESHLIGHEKEFRMAELILERPSQNSLILVGDPGVGKGTFINFLAKRIKEQKEKNTLGNKRLVEIDLRELISNQSSELVENEIGKIFYEAAFAGNVILVINDLHEFLDLKKEKEGLNLGKILSDFLAIPSFQIIGTVPSEAYHEILERNSAILKNIDLINFVELTEEETLESLLWWLKEREDKGVLVTYQALKKVVELSGQFVTRVPFPEKAIDSLEEIIIYWVKAESHHFLSEDDCNQFFSDKFNVPLGKIGNDEKDKLVNLESILHKRVIGQGEAIRNISEAMRRTRSGISDKDKLIGSFLFLGPTGVGKTETAKSFAEAYFGSESRMLRFDMTEFQGKDSIDRFIGSKSRNESSQFINKVSENPFSVILLDEIEKADSDVLDLLLQVLDEGWITDVFGKKAMLNKTIIIATSNAGANLIEKGCSDSVELKLIYDNVIDYIVKENIFRPEFLNRFSKVILFSSLKDDELKKATAIVLEEISKRAYKNKKITLTFEDGIIEKIIEKGYNHVFGMRSIKHFAQNLIEDMIAKKIISEEWKNGTEAEIKIKDLDFESAQDN